MAAIQIYIDTTNRDYVNIDGKLHPRGFHISPIGTDSILIQTYKSVTRDINEAYYFFEYTDLRDGDNNTFASRTLAIEYLKSVLSGQEIALTQGGNPVDFNNPLPSYLSTDNPTGTAFGRLRVANEQKKIEISAIDGKQPLFINEELTLTATSVAANSVVTMSTSTLSDYVVRQTKQRGVYQKGNSQLALLTFDSFQVQNGIEKRVGYFTSSTAAPFTANRDGIFLQSIGSTGLISIVQAKNGTETVVNQSNWNLDTLDGSGVSGVTIDWSQRNIFVIDVEWLGVGRVRVGMNVDGVTYYFHEFNNANNGTGVYMLNGSKPLRWEIRQTGNLVTGSFTQICGSISSEGSQNQLGKIRAAEANNIQANSVGTVYPVVGIRIQSGKDFCQIDLKRVALRAGTNDDFKIYVLFNPTLSGTPTWTAESEGVIESASGAGFTVTNRNINIGILYGAGNFAGAFDIPSELRLGTNIDGTRDEIWLAVDPFTSNLDIWGALSYQEQI